MKNPSDAVRDPARLQALRAADLLDTPPEEAFDQMIRLASRLLRTPTALVSLVDEERQFFKACIGVAEPWATARATPLSHSFCQYVVSEREPLVVEDAREHPVLKDNLAIRDLGVIAYLGVPLFTSDGSALGTLCVIDSKPRQWTEEDLETLRSLAASVMSTIQLRSAARAAHRERKQDEPVAAKAGVGDVSASLRAARATAEALWNTACTFLERLDDYDRLIRSYEPTAESLQEEARLRERIQQAEEELQQTVSEFAGMAAVTRKYPHDPLLRSAESLAAAISEYLEAQKRRAEASQHFQQLAGPLDELERAVALAARAEGRVREAADAFEMVR